MATNNSDGDSEPINFRAALAAFQKNSAASDAPSATTLHSPRPRPLQPSSGRQPPQTPARPSSGLDPVPRSSSAPRIRNDTDGPTSPASNNPFASRSSLHPSSAIPSTSASGMLSSHSPNAGAPLWPKLRKSGSDVSLNELKDKSLPYDSADRLSAHTLPRSRSRSILGAQSSKASSNAGSAPASGRSSPYGPSRTIHNLFSTEDDNDAPRHTDSPTSASTSQHMLDTSADDAMFAHAVMERSTPLASPRAREAAESDSYLVPPQVPSRKGSASSTNSTTGSVPSPKLPPRPMAATSLAPSPTISEFGQFPASAPTLKARTGLAYATYTPGAKRNAQNGNVDVGATPPALPPRSATISHRAEQSPVRRAPTIPKKPAATSSAAGKPAPPPRPEKASEGTPAAGATVTQTQLPPPPRQRTTSVQSQRSLTGASNSSTPSSASVAARTHKKSGSNVFTSISLSDDASSELKRSLESDLHSDHHTSQLPPPTRGKPGAYATLPPSARASFSSTASGSASGGVVSSLIGTAASAIPLFKSSSPFSGAGAGGMSRSLADGAPSKQLHYAGGVMVSRSASAHSDVSAEGEAALWGVGRTVQLADDVSVLSSRTQRRGLLREPKEESARRRYEGLFDELLAGQKKDTSPGSNASTIREGRSAGDADGRPGGGVQALRGWFESDTAPSHTAPATDTPSKPSTLPTTSTALSRKTVRKIWTRSRLPSSFLAQVWDQASRSQPSEGLEKESFVRAMACLDAELERRKQRRRQRQGRAKNRETAGVGRRVPPPPPAAAVTSSQ